MTEEPAIETVINETVEEPTEKIKQPRKPRATRKPKIITVSVDDTNLSFDEGKPTETEQPEVKPLKKSRAPRKKIINIEYVEDDPKTQEEPTITEKPKPKAKAKSTSKRKQQVPEVDSLITQNATKKIILPTNEKQNHPASDTTERDIIMEMNSDLEKNISLNIKKIKEARDKRKIDHIKSLVAQAF